MPPERRKRSERRRSGLPGRQAPPRALGPAGAPAVHSFRDMRQMYSQEPQPLFESTPQGDDFSQDSFSAGERPFLGPWRAILIVCLLLLCAMAAFVIRSASREGEFESRRAFLAQPVIFGKVTIDGQSVGGLTKEQAAQRLSGAGPEGGDFSLKVRIDGRVYPLSAQDLSMSRSLKDALDTAFAVGRQGFSWMIGSDRTPFDIRWEHAKHIERTGLTLQTRAAYSDEGLRRAAEQLAASASRGAVNAELASFDFDSKTFTVTKDKPGAAISAETVYQALKAALSSSQPQGEVALYTQPVAPEVTAQQLQQSMRLISSFSTKATGDAARNQNIALAAAAIHGLAVMPGESFSFNGVVGQRTQAGGYQFAPAIAGGQTVEEIGGGVCQVSSTLFNAAAMADMTILKREPHAWPSNYVEMGLDATVNWPNLDFSFRNDTQGPVFIVADFSGRTLTVELYGARQDGTESIRLETELVASTPAPEEPLYRQNPELLPGTQQVVKKARTGYQVDTYRVYLREGAPYRREKLFTSVYPAAQQVIEYN